MMLEAFITNLGRYNEGYLDGAYLKLPAEKEDVQALLKKIHVDGVRYEEIFITDYETDVPGLYDCLGEYESIDELNHLAHVLQEVEDQHDMDKFAAAVELGNHTGSIRELINLAQNLDCYYFFYPDIKDEEDLRLYFVEELGALDIPDNLRAFFDFEAYGRCLAMEGGTFTDEGYIEEVSGFVEVYTGRDDIPEEHRIFAYPEPAPIRETLQTYRDLSVKPPEAERPAPAKAAER